jgi:hypothetical protein
MKYVAMDKDNKIKELEVTKAHLKKYTEIEYDKVSKFIMINTRKIKM